MLFQSDFPNLLPFHISRTCTNDPNYRNFKSCQSFIIGTLASPIRKQKRYLHESWKGHSMSSNSDGFPDSQLCCSSNGLVNITLSQSFLICFSPGYLQHTRSSLSLMKFTPIYESAWHNTLVVFKVLQDSLWFLISS